MTIDSRQKRSRLGYQRFFSSILCTLFFLSLYLLGLYYIPAPELFLEKFGQVPKRKLLGWVFDYQIQVNFVIFVLSVPFTIVSNVFRKKQGIEEKQKLERIQLTLSRFLKPNVIAFVGVFGV